MKPCYKFIASGALLLTIAGCSSDGDLDDLRNYAAEVNARPKGRIEPLPEFQPYENFDYSASGLREPFSAPVEIQLMKYQQEQAQSNIKPDLDRPKEYLESFSIDTLNMVGTITTAEGELWALVDDGEGGVHRVQPGNYLGKNYGRIVGLDEGQIDIVEIVPDGHGGWLERPRALKLQDDI